MTLLPCLAFEMIFDLELSFVKVTEAERAEVNPPDVVVDRFEAEVLASQDVGDIDPLRVPPDASVPAHESYLEVSGVLDFGETIGEGSSRRLVERGRRFLGESLMRALEVELVPEGVEASLLSRAVPGGRPGRFVLEGSMHPLVSPVLLGLSEFDQCRSDAESDPPDGECREPSDCGSGEGATVVREHDHGKPELSKDALEHGLGA